MKKGFTLIELLAVIVILAVIAVIAVPIVLNIINDTKESATLRSAEFYLRGLETSIATSVLKNIQVPDGKYFIMEDGNICIGSLTNNTCTGEILKVEMDGEVPTEGTIKVKDGQIKTVDIILSDKEIWIDPFTEQLAYKLAPGLYDENDKLLMSWDELKTQPNFIDSLEYNVEGSSDYIGLAGNLINSIEGASKLILSEEITTIGIKPFYDCTSLETLIIPDSVTIIGNYAFEGCTNLTSVVIASSVTTWGDSVFSRCEKLTNVILEDGLRNVGNSAFRDCIALTSIKLPETLESIGTGAFQNSALTTITIPNRVTRIETGTFNSCANLTSITIPNSVTSIGGAVFTNCTSLTTITIPNSVTSIGDDIFEGCTSLTTIYNKGTATGAPWGAPNATVISDF